MDGLDIHPAQRPVEVDSKQKHGLVTTLLHLEVEVSAPDRRMILEAVTLTHVVVIIDSEIIYSIISSNSSNTLQNLSKVWNVI